MGVIRINDEVAFDYRVSVIDLDPKIVTNIPHYMDLDRSIVENYAALHPEFLCMPSSSSSSSCSDNGIQQHKETSNQT